MQETLVQFLGQEDPLEKEIATHSDILAWRIPMDSGAWQATVHGVARLRQDLATKPPPPIILLLSNDQKINILYISLTNKSFLESSIIFKCKGVQRIKKYIF